MSKGTGKVRVFVPLMKVDEDQRLVYGRITQEVVDKSNEIMDYETSKPNFQKWSDGFDEKTGGLSKGNLRVMHGLTVAGKLTDISYDDEALAIDVCAKVVDDAEWNKVLEGCYTGFSVGGRYGKKWNDTIDGQMVKRFTAVPGEVSLVDDPCVPVATFDCIKADGSVMQKMFKVAGDPVVVEEEVKTEEVKTEEVEVQAEMNFSNDEVVTKATEIATAKDDGTTWMDHVATARDELMKAAPKKAAKKDDKTEADKSSSETDTDKEADKTGTGDTSNKVTAPGVKQVWTASDGKTFEKKADAETHEASLVKVAEENKTDAQKLADRLSKAMTEEAVPEEVGILDDYDRVGKVIQVLKSPWENGAPKLEKGMYTVSRFANMLWDLGALTRCIAREGAEEGGDSDDVKVSDNMKTAMATLGESLKTYLDDQVTELLAGLDDNVVVEVYDYYYRAAQEDPKDQLAKDMTEVITDRRDGSRELREELTKAFLVDAGEPMETVEVEMSGDLQKKFDKLTGENDELKKIATQAVEAVETLTKRVTTLEDTPLPRAPRGELMLRPGDQDFFGKRVTTEGDKVAVLQELLAEHGPDNLATMMIKASHATGGQKLNLKQ